MFGQTLLNFLFSYRENGPTLVDSSTQVSAPPTPVKVPLQTSVTDRSQNESILRADDSHLNPSLNIGPAETSIIPLEINKNEDDGMTTDKLGLQDVQKITDVDDYIANYGYTSPGPEDIDDNTISPPKPPEQSCAMVQRMNDLGVSFIEKKDLFSKVMLNSLKVCICLHVIL